MTSARLFQGLSKLIPVDRMAETLAALKQESTVWNGLCDSDLFEKVSQGWPVGEKEISPASLALFLTDADLLMGNYPETQPSTALLEEAMMAYEEFIQKTQEPENLLQVAKLAIALNEKYKLNNDWAKIIREPVAKQTIDSTEKFVELWGGPCAVLFGWQEDRVEFLQSLLQIKQPELGLDMLRHVVLALPVDCDEQAQLLTGAYHLLPLNLQISALQKLRMYGNTKLAGKIAKDLFSRHVVKEQEGKSVSETWQASEKSLNSSVVCRQLAALAQMVGEYEAANHLLNLAEGYLLAELAGVLVQNSSLQVEQGFSPAEQIERIPQSIRSNNDVANELALVSDDVLPISDIESIDSEASPALELHDAVAIFAAKNETLAKEMAQKSMRGWMNNGNHLFDPQNGLRALNWSPRRVLEQLMHMGLWNEARQLLNDLLDVNPTDVFLLNHAVVIAQNQADAGALLSALEDLALLDRENLQTRRLLAQTFANNEDWQNANYLFEDLLQHFGSVDEEDLLGYAYTAMKCGQYQTAIESAQKVIEEKPENSQALAILGFSQHKLGNSEKAFEFLNRSVSMATDSIEPWLLLADLYNEKGQSQKSIETLKTAKSAFPGDKKVKIQLAKEFIAQGQPAEAISIIREDNAGELMDKEVQLLAIKAMKELNLPELDETVEKTYQAFQTDAEMIYEFAAMQLRKGFNSETREMLKDIVRCLDSRPEWKLTYADAVLGENYRNLHVAPSLIPNDHDQVEQWLDEVLSIDPENVYAKVIKAENWIKTGQTEKAFEFLSNLLGSSSAQNTNWLERIQAGFAWVAQLLKKFDLALPAIQNVVEAHPEWAGASQTLAEVEQSTGEIEEAVNQAVQVLEIAPDVVESVEWFANFMSSLGKEAEAEKTIQEFAKTHGEKLPFLLKLAELKLGRNEIHEAKGVAESFKRLLPRTKSDQELVRAARLFDQLDDSQTTIDCLKKRLEIPGVSAAGAFTDLAGYMRGRGENNKALEIITQLSQKIGEQRWLTLLKSETLRSLGKTNEAFELLNNLPDSDENRPEPDNLSFIPKEWKRLIQAQDSTHTLAGTLAFEVGDYQHALEQSDLGVEDVQNQVMAIEAEYALGGGKNIIARLDSIAADKALYEDAILVAQTAEILLDAGQSDKAAQIISRSFELFPQDEVLPFLASRLAVVQNDPVAGEELFKQGLSHYAITNRLYDAQAVCAVRNLIKAAGELNRWMEALDWSRVLLQSQPRNTAAIQLNLQVLAQALEFANLTRSLGLQQHLLADDDTIHGIQNELTSTLSKLEAEKNTNLEHWIARGRTVLDPSQTNIRRLALITPETDDIAAMMLALHRSGQTPTALQLSKKHDSDAKISYAAAYCLSETDPQKAIDCLRKNNQTGQVQPWANALSALLYQKLGETYSAINEIEEALQTWPQEPTWHLTASELWQSSGDSQNVIAHLEQAEKLLPEDSQVKLRLGKAYLQAKEAGKAIQTLEPASKKEVNQYEIWESLAEAYYQAGDNVLALETAEKAAQINEFSVKPYILSAKINLDNGAVDKALVLAQTAVKHDEQNAEGLVLLAKALFANGNKLQALQALEKVSACKNATVQVMIDHAELIKEINGAANSKVLFESLVQKYPDNVELVNLLAEAQLASGDKSGAEISAQRSLKMQEMQPKMQRFLGRIEFEGGHLDQAIHHYSQAIAQAPQQVDVYLDLSNAYVQQRDFDLALKTLNKAMELDASDARPLLAAVNLLRNAKDYARAETLLRKAAEIAPSDLNIRRQLGAVIALNLVHSSQEASSHI